MKSRRCDNCNSEVITIKRGRRISVECSYCGEPYEEVGIEDFITEDGDEDE
jgi:hypothetical protein